jgi:hypothetical protein
MYETVYYTLKSGIITDKSNGLDVIVSYSYDSNGRLIKKNVDNEYGGENIETATYNSNGQIVEYKSFDTRDGLSVYEKIYTYNSLGLLAEVKEEEAYYSIPWDQIEQETKKPVVLTTLDYKKYLEDDRMINEKVIVFKYNEENKLLEVKQNYNGYSKDGTAYFNPDDYDNFTYKIKHKPNKLFVEASMPAKRLYEYTFDSKNNPINIKSYVVTASGNWLHKETILKITYK